MMIVRHGFMIVGLPFSGKTSAYKVLSGALAIIEAKVSELNTYNIHKYIYTMQCTFTEAYFGTCYGGEGGTNSFQNPNETFPPHLTANYYYY